jgi:hypothetical protein
VDAPEHEHEGEYVNVAEVEHVEKYRSMYQRNRY